MKTLRITVDGKQYDVTVEELDAGDGMQNSTADLSNIESTKTSLPKMAINGTSVKAPMNGVISDIKVKVNDKVEKGAVLAILEAMKMENDIVAPLGGTVKAVNVEKGQSIKEGKDIIVIG